MKSLIIKKSKSGKGVFANRKFRKGEVILIPRGELLTKEKINKKKNFKWFMDHSLQIEEDLFMGPAYDFEDFVNHGCNPNSGHIINGKKIRFVAIKNIKKGEEITFDYSTTMFNTKEKMECECGSKNCRLVIEDFDKLPLRLQRKYIKLGIVPNYIQRGV